MSEQRSIVLDSRWTSLGLTAGCVLYAFVLVDLVKDLPAGVAIFCIYSLLGVGLIYTTWASAAVIRIDEKEFVVNALFGLGPSKKLKMEDVRRLLMRPNNFDRVTRVVVEFADGRRIQLHQYQRNFEAARMFLSERLGSVPCEVQSKWAL